MNIDNPGDLNFFDSLPTGDQKPTTPKRVPKLPEPPQADPAAVNTIDVATYKLPQRSPEEQAKLNQRQQDYLWETDDPRVWGRIW